MSSFEASWLDLREPVDHRARHAGLRHLALKFLEKGVAEERIVDLGCGTGSTLRALLPEAASRRWRLLDHDPDLLREARMRHGNDHIEFLRFDLAELKDIFFADARLVTASALFDLMPATVVETLSIQLRSIGVSLYAALNYDGYCTWSDRHEADAAVVNAFNKHQRGNKGLGPALGPDSGPALKRIFEAAGYRVLMAPSPWQIGPKEAELQRQFIEGMANAASKTHSLDPRMLEDWRANRLARTHTSTCTVGHWDVLALTSLEPHIEDTSTKQTAGPPDPECCSNGEP